jgi:hypothetical protein
MFLSPNKSAPRLEQSTYYGAFLSDSRERERDRSREKERGGERKRKKEIE